MFGLTVYAKMSRMRKEDEQKLFDLFQPAEHDQRAQRFVHAVQMYIAQHTGHETGTYMNVLDAYDDSLEMATKFADRVEDPDDYKLEADEIERQTVSRITKKVYFVGWRDQLDLEKAVRDIGRMAEVYGGIRDENEYVLSLGEDDMDFENTDNYSPNCFDNLESIDSMYNDATLSTWRVFHFYAEHAKPKKGGNSLFGY